MRSGCGNLFVGFGCVDFMDRVNWLLAMAN